MEIKVYEAYVIKSGNDCKKIGVKKPGTFINQCNMIEMIEMMKPFEKMFFAYYVDIEEIIPATIRDKYATSSREAFNENPKMFGVLCYKNNRGRLKFK